ncbi:MAG TPA: sugar transferase [Acidimicrobiales bacterium]|jgi:lipopolysaccharide/colanic/teichoic acid biosynthesis glycosyltransferase|nr:sugar transferase [Acidimicrobiales bacterium]
MGVYGGAAAVVLALSKVHAALVAAVPYSWHSSPRMAWSAAFVVLLALAAYGLGLPDLVRTRRRAVAAAVVAPLGAALAMAILQLAAGDALLPRFVVFGSALALIPWNLACQTVANAGRGRAEHRERVVVVADRNEVVTLLFELNGEAERPARVVGSLEIAEARAGAAGPGSRPVAELVSAKEATVVVVDHAAQLEETIVAQVADLHQRGVRVRTLELFYEEWLGKLPVSELERTSLLFDIGEVHQARYARLKRLVDLPLAIAGLAALVVAIPLVALGNLFANRGPLFFRQERVGRGGRTFSIVKFRTMAAAPAGAAEAQHDRDAWTAEDDPRITPFGRLLRRSHLDELPQVVNIIRGELAVVGPRPEQPAYVDELAHKLPFYQLRHLVHPGLTGWAQVKYGYAGDETDALEKLQYEFFYLRHQCVGFDLKIIGRTLRSVLGRQGR